MSYHTEPQIFKEIWPVNVYGQCAVKVTLQYSPTNVLQLQLGLRVAGHARVPLPAVKSQKKKRRGKQVSMEGKKKGAVKDEAQKHIKTDRRDSVK